jgi:hypothetical protein
MIEKNKKINKKEKEVEEQIKLVPDYHCLDVAYADYVRLWPLQFNVFYLSSFHQGVCLFSK